MNKTDILAQEQFDGDLEKTIIHILDTFDTEPLNEYVGDFNKEQSGIFLRILGDRISERVPKDVREAAVSTVVDLSALGMTEEEVRNATENPFKKKVLKNILCLLAVVVCVPCIAYLVPSLHDLSDEIISVGGIIITGFSLSLTHNLLRFFKFRKLKKNLSKSGKICDAS